MDYTVLFKTPHGSHLYGLATPESDRDYYVVVDKVKTAKSKYAKHSIIDGIDTTLVDFGTWVDMMQKGVPQALEAAFSTMPEVDLLTSYRAQVRVGHGAQERYLSTIKSFCYAIPDFKHKRHALRLALNMADIRRYGRFNPTLDSHEIKRVNYMASFDENEVYDLCRNIIYKA